MEKKSNYSRISQSYGFKESMTKHEVWYFLNGIKETTVSHLSEEKWLEVKLACDEMFQTFTNGEWKICPGWWFSL